VSTPTWRCGHPRTPENTVGQYPAKPYGQCRTCKNASDKLWRAKLKLRDG
jgi:hypothetical protein